MILWPLGGYRRLTQPGEWRVMVRWIGGRFRWSSRVEEFREGAVYLLFCGWILVKVMVKA